MLCAPCGQPTDAAPCRACGADPQLNGRYTLTDVLGQGAQGTTFAAEGPHGAVAIKELPVGRSTDPQALARLQREADILGQLTHPAIPRLRETFFSGEGRARSLYVVQDRAEGVDLERWLATHRTSEDEVVGILVELCAVLAWLHGRSPPVLHRDLKPANVIRAPDGALRLVDFGSVRDALRDPALGGSTVAGTFGYMAPEQMVGDASPRSDLYSLGALAVRLLTRQQPATLLDRSGHMQWRPHARVSPALGALLDALLAPDPADRPASADAVKAGLERRESPAELAPVRAPAPGPRPAGARPAAVERAADLLRRGYADGELVRAGAGWRWVDLGGRVTVDLEPTPGGLVARPRVPLGGAIAAVTLAALALAGGWGLVGWSLVAGVTVAKKAVALAVAIAMMAIAPGGGVVSAVVARRRRVLGALRAAGARVEGRGPPARTLPGAPTEARARALADRYSGAVGEAGELVRLGDGWRWRSKEGISRVDLLLTPGPGGTTRAAVREGFHGAVGGIYGGAAGVVGGLLGGLGWWFFQLSSAAGMMWLFFVPLVIFGLAAGVHRALARRRSAHVNGGLDALDEAPLALPAPDPEAQ